jgi:4-hydroxy-tetrahydrodipicolinate synthase
MRLSFTGVGTALITPFTKSGALDEAAVKRLARRQADAGIHFVVPCGTTGEAPTLTTPERRRVVELVADEIEGRAMVLAGAGGYNTRDVIADIAEMEQAGAHGILSVTPYYNKPTQEGLFQHYRTIADSTKLPIILYNVPGRTGCNLEPATVARLADLPNIVGVKEASPNMAQTVEILRLVPAEFLILSGDDELTLPRMAVGGRGVISVASNQAPAEMVQMVEAAERGDFASARRWHEKLVALMLGNFVEANPIPVKFGMAQMGLCENVYRLPLVPPAAASQETILKVLRDFGLPLVAESHA